MAFHLGVSFHKGPTTKKELVIVEQLKEAYHIHFGIFQQYNL